MSAGNPRETLEAAYEGLRSLRLRLRSRSVRAFDRDGADLLEGSIQQNIIAIASQDDKDVEDASEEFSDRKAA